MPAEEWPMVHNRQVEGSVLGARETYALPRMKNYLVLITKGYFVPLLWRTVSQRNALRLKRMKIQQSFPGVQQCRGEETGCDATSK